MTVAVADRLPAFAGAIPAYPTVALPGAVMFALGSSHGRARSVGKVMALESLLVANRGEIAVRILRSAAELGLRTVAVYSTDDARSLHLRRADASRALSERGPAAYLNGAALIAIARETGCDAIHPGYGFLSESADFARACEEEGIRFVGPEPETLRQFGDKLRARAFAKACGVRTAAGTEGPLTLDGARAFLADLGADGAVMVKAVAGGGGRGLRVVRSVSELEAALERCRSEALRAFGSGALYLEQWLPRARHLEVQVIGDGSGDVAHLYERECSLQRRHQKLVEVAPSPRLSSVQRERLTRAALKLAERVRYRSLGTFEFLLDAAAPDREAVFIEANPRLQVEHTVTEEVMGIDLLRAQLEIAGGKSLAELGLRQHEIPAPQGFAIQLRINMEKMADDGTPRPSTGTLSAFEPPSGPGLRCDTCGYAGYKPSTRFDSLLAKLVAHSSLPDFAATVARAARGLREFRIEGIATNQGFLRGVLAHPDFAGGRVTTGWIEEHAREFARQNAEPLFFDATPAEAGAAEARARDGESGAAPQSARLDAGDPLAVLEYGRSAAPSSVAASPLATEAAHTVPARDESHATPEGALSVAAPVQGTVIGMDAAPGQLVPEGAPLLVMEAMKLEHVVAAPCAGVVLRVLVAVGDTVAEAHPLLHFEARAFEGEARAKLETEADLDHIRPDLAELFERRAGLQDEARPEALARRRRTGQRTARENISDLCDPGSFIEYAPLVIAAQRRRRSLEDLIEKTPADGLVGGVGTVNAETFGKEAARCVLMSYDYTVLAGTQGLQNHRKKDRLFALAEEWRLPLLLFSEGGGGRPGDTDGPGGAGLDCWAFRYFAALSGRVPLVGINSGRCFAGNAALLGCCDVVIATANSNIGMGGPAMIEGGGLGVFRPEDIGPMSVQVPNGVVDLPVADEAEAVVVTKQYLGYFQGALPSFRAADQRLLRSAIPENRKRGYDLRRLVETLVDTGSLLELRRAFGRGMLTALARIEGRPIGVIANDTTHLAGAIESDGADKAARFMQLCDAFALPIVSLCDTPGIMVGPEVERRALVRHAARMFITGASLRVPMFTVVLRKAYGLGAQTMAGGSFKAPFFTVSWPTGEFGGMGLEGAVKLGYRRELEAITEPAKRRAHFEEMVERMYQHGKALSTASHFEIDDVIDPAETRSWLVRGLRSTKPPARDERHRRFVDSW